MARILVLFLILLKALVVVANANNVAALATSTASMPSNNVEQDAAEAPQKPQHKVTRSSAAPCLSPSETPLAKDNMHYSEGTISSNQESSATEVQDIKIKKEHHHSFDKSVAGGGVILGGLATTFLVAIACYIRATGRKNGEPTSPTSPSSKV